MKVIQKSLLKDLTATGISPVQGVIEYNFTVFIDQTDTPTATVEIEYSSNWVDWSAFPNSVFTTTWTSTYDTFTSTAVVPYIRANITAYTAGTINVRIAWRQEY